MKTFDSLFKALNNELTHQKLVGHKHPSSMEVHMLCNR